MKHKKFIFLFVFLMAWLTLLVFVPPNELVEVMGVETGYLLIFLTALVGISSFSSGSFYAVLLTLASTGEFNPILLAAVAAPAMAFGDAVFFVFSSNGREVVEEKLNRRAKAITDWTKKLSQKHVFWTAYIYSGFTPLPQDILMVSLGLGGAKIRTVIGAVLLGNATFVFLVSSLVMYVI